MQTYGLDWLALVLLAAGVWWLMPRAARWPRIVGFAFALAGTLLGLYRLHVPGEGPVETALFSLFSAAAVFCAILMITNRNPVYSALWFAMVTLNVCGLFLLQFAPFLAAATVIVYAGAIVVTFVFVIMLAQQSGATIYDQRSRQPVVGVVAAFAVLALVLAALGRSTADQAVNHPVDAVADDRAGVGARSEEVRVAADAPTTDVGANPLSHVQPNDARWTLRALGRSLFGDYLFAVELAGTILLVATIGAIAIAPRRARGTL
jgi:NADH-quinone oxidoreductase subunit J